MLTNSGIKAGVDTDLFRSELSKAKVEYINLHKQLEILQWNLARLIVIENVPVPQILLFIHIASKWMLTDNDFNLHPFVKYSQSQFELSQSKEQQIKKSYLPKIKCLGSGFCQRLRVSG